MYNKHINSIRVTILSYLLLFSKMISEPGWCTGKLMYLTITRPYIIFVVNRLRQFASIPKKSHLQAAYKVFHYLKGITNLGLFYSATSNPILKSFINADWSACLDTRRSTSGFACFLVHLSSPGSQRNNKLCLISFLC